nr:MauE/DoxX family redox-associated membrane protein [Pedobacter panaciterrae]
MKRALIFGNITFIAAVLLLMLFAYAGISKVADYQRFVAQMKLAPAPLIQNLSGTLGWLVPLIEFIIIGLLAKDKLRKIGLYASFILLLSFQVYISVMLLSGLELPCTCGGLISKLQWKEHLVFNAVFMLIAMFPFIFKWINAKYYKYELTIL